MPHTVPKAGFKAGFMRRFHAATGLSCPVCLLAVAVTIALAGVSFGAVLLDRVRTVQQAGLTAKGVADIARQRTVDLLARVDTTLQAVQDGINGPPGADPARLRRLDDLVSQRRRLEPRVLALYVLDDNGGVVSSSIAANLRSGALAQNCLRDEHAEPDQVVLKPVVTSLAGGVNARGLCFLRGVRAPGFSGAIVAVIGMDLLQVQYADLTIGPHGSVTLLDENGRLIARVIAGQTMTVQTGAGQASGGESPGEPRAGPDLSQLAAGNAPDSADGGITEARRVEGPVGAIVAVSITAEDVLASWYARSALVSSSVLIVLAFVTMAVLAVRSCERREIGRLERLAAMSADLYGSPSRAQLAQRLVEGAEELAAAELVPPPDGRLIADLADPDRPMMLSILQPGVVRIGAMTLRRRNGGAFTSGDLAFLGVLARIADTEIRHVTALADARSEATSQREAAERGRLAIDTVHNEMSDATFTLDAGWRFVESNRNADKLFGEYPEDLRNRSIWDIFPELAGSVFETECRRAVQDGHPATFEMKWMRNDTWLLAHAYPRPPGLALYLQDISRQVVADDKLRQSAKMDAIGRLTGGIAHDFNNLLTVILGNTEMLDVELPETGEVRDMHDQIRRAAQSAAELTHQLLAFARRQPLSPTDVDASRLVYGLDSLLRRTLGASVSLDIRCPPSLWQARVDPTQLENAILNLAINARDAMPSGGRLTIEVANLALRKPDIDQFGELRPGNYVVISVSDTGSGIPKDVIGKVFDPFFTTKPPGRGTGLGLSMVYGFVTQSGGHARIVSEIGRGTTVRLYLPGVGEARPSEAGDARAAAAQASGPDPRRPDTTLPGGLEHILVVEDSDMVRDYAQSVLTALGYRVTVAAEGRQALDLLDRGLQPDMLLTDVLLPNGLDGVRLAELVLERRPGIPVLYMSGYVENVDIHKKHLDPQTNLLLKPFRRASLAAMVRARLDPTPGGTSQPRRA